MTDPLPEGARLLGEVVLLQVHRAAIAVEDGYDVSHLLDAEALSIGPHGVSGLVAGAWVLDVHHDAHPERRGDGRRALSIGFTGHYRLMAQRFGEVPLGVGAENLVVDAPGRIDPGDLAGGVLVAGTDGPIPLHGARVAEPCRQFTSHLLGRGDVARREEITADLEFLSGGMRGFILDTDRVAHPMRVHRGDLVWIAPA